MATFTLTGNTNIDALTSKGGGDTYNTAGFTLTIDQDSRVGLNQTTTAVLGNVTITAATGGAVNIDGTDIWMIPYSSGSGNVPAWNTVITQSGQDGTGKLIAVHSSLTAASTATGASMPASGFIRIKQKSGTFAAGALTGIGATADDAGRVGWIEVVGEEALTVTANRLGSFNVTGEWYKIGTTNGSSNQTMQIPNNGLNRYAAGVFIEQTSGAGDYEFYPNAGTTTTTGTEASRGKVVWIDNAGLVRIGNSGAATNGYTPVTGLAVVIGNVFLENATNALRTANAIPHATIGTRYDFTCTGGGVVTMDKCNCAWYGSFSQAYSVTCTNTGFVDGILLNEVATAMTWSKVGVGNKPTTALLMSPLTMTSCFAGGTFTDCVWARVSMVSSGSHTNTLTDITGFTFVRDTIRANTIKGHATTYAVNGTRLRSCTWTTPTVIQGPMVFTTCDGITVTDIIYCNCVSGTTVTTYATYWYLITSNTLNCLFSGGTMPVTNTHPYTALMAASVSCNNIKLRNIGTRSSPVTLGSTNACGLIYSVASGTSNVKVQRVFCSNTRTGLMTGDNSCKNITEEHVFGDYADTAVVMACLNLTRKAMGGTGALTAQTAVYGTHWMDLFTSTTAGRIAILMNEPSAETASQVTLANGAGFTSAGGLYMPVIGHQAIFETPNYVKGHTAFANSALIMAGGTATNYTYQYQIDKNDGAGFSSWSSDKTPTTLGTALNGETLNAQLGFKLKLKITTSTTNATAITSVYMTTDSTTTAQDYLYPLDTVSVSITVQDASDFSDVEDARVILEADTGGDLPALDSVTIARSGSTASVAHTAHGMSAGSTVIIRGADQEEYNGRFVIGNVTTNAYDYTVSGTPTTPATGTITATAQILTGLTDASGIVSTSTFEFSNDQPVIGKARKASSGTKYKEGTIIGTITSAGFSATSLLVRDE